MAPAYSAANKTQRSETLSWHLKSDVLSPQTNPVSIGYLPKQPGVFPCPLVSVEQPHTSRLLQVG